MAHQTESFPRRRFWSFIISKSFLTGVWAQYNHLDLATPYQLRTVHYFTGKGVQAKFEAKRQSVILI